jgi:hypothetical protein
MNHKFKIDPINIQEKYEIDDEHDIYLSDSKLIFLLWITSFVFDFLILNSWRLAVGIWDFQYKDGDDK